LQISLSITLPSGATLQQSFARDAPIVDVINAAIAHQGHGAASREAPLAFDDVRLCLFVPTGAVDAGKQSVLLLDAHRRLSDVGALNRHVVTASLSSTTLVAVGGALLTHWRVGNEWDCISLARCVDCASCWLVDTPETTACVDAMVRLLHRLAEQSPSIRRLSMVNELTSRVPQATLRTLSSPGMRVASSTSSCALDSDAAVESTERRKRHASVDHVTIVESFSVQIVGCELPTDAAHKILDSLGHAELCVTACVRYGALLLGDAHTTTAVVAAKSGTRSFVTWNHMMQLDVLISTLPREACLDVRLCAVSIAAGVATTM
jgi:hypothetical protein